MSTFAQRERRSRKNNFEQQQLEKLAAAGVSPVNWLAQRPSVERRMAEMQRREESCRELVAVWTTTVASLPALTTEQLFAASVIGSRCSEQRVLAEALLAGVSKADCRQRTPSQVSDILKQRHMHAKAAAEAARGRLWLEEAAMCLLEAQSDMPVVLVQLVAQYVNSDFDVQPYVSIYKQLQ